MQTSLNLLFQRTLFLMFPHFQKYLKPQARTNKLVIKVFYHPCHSRLASGIHLSYFFKLLRVLSLKNACWVFYSNICGKHFPIYVFIFLENALNLYIFTHAPVLHSKLLVEFFENLFPQNGRGGRSYDLLYQNSVRKYEDGLVH